MDAKAETFCKVLVFAKAPVAGKVKTRLIPLLGAKGAAKLHEKLTRQALKVALKSSLGTVELWCAPTCNHPFFLRLAKEYGVSLHLQSSGNLGERMYHAFEASITNAERVLIIGSDCPALTPQHLCEADAALKSGQDAVFCPAEDGGYVLINLKRCSSELFQGVEWSTARVMEQTRERLKRLKWRWHEMPLLWDVDRPDDHRRLATLPGWNSLAAQ